MPQYKVSYFNIRGLAEHIRMLLLDQGLEFEDDQFSKDEWYGGRKAEATFGQCPFLTEGGRQIPQSNTIMRHLARVHGLYGNTEEEKTMCDMVADGAQDLRNKYYEIVYRAYERKEEFAAKELPGMLVAFEKILAARPDPKAPFLLGTKVWTLDAQGTSLASSDSIEIAFTDYILWELLECLVILVSPCLDAFPHLKAYHAHLPEGRPKLAAYLASDKRKALPVNNNGKQ